MYLVNCRNPLSLDNGQNLMRNDSWPWIVNVSGYSHPAMEGANINFMCSPNHTLIGPRSAVCMGNGEWEPDPRGVKCIGKEYSYSYVAN